MIGTNIKNARLLKGMSQQELADKMGYTKSAISRIENNERNITQTKISEFSKVLGVSIAYLMDWDVEKIDEVESMYKESRQMERMSKYAEILSNLSLTDEETEQMVKYATFLKESREGANNEDKRT